MPVTSLEFRFRQPLRAPADVAYRWCTDFGPADAKLLSGTTQRSVRRIGEDALILTDTSFPGGRRRRIRRLVRLFPSERAWTNTHLDGPFRHSQYWYRVVADGPKRSHLEFHGLRLVTSGRALPASEKARLTSAERAADSGAWRRQIAPALERELGASGGRSRRGS